jgi:hypothetical protein
MASHSLVASNDEVVMAKKTSCEFVLRTCVSEALKDEIERAASEQGRTTSDVIRRALIDCFAKPMMARELVEAA